jgi:ribose-phosphate pyrophosphokinase
MSATLHFFPGYEVEAQSLASALGLAGRCVTIRTFPDGESLVRVVPGAGTALLYCSLDRSDDKLVQLLLAASALRDGGAERLVLIAPYLGYMRQDQAFAPGEAVSQRVIGGLIATNFDGLVTVDPHLHRTPSLEAVTPGIMAVNVSAAETLARAISEVAPPDIILIGPDEESRVWVEAVAAPLQLEVMVGQKLRMGDRKVAIALQDVCRVKGRPAILVDDVISSGGTMIACASQLREAGALRIDAVATHCLATVADLAALAASGIASVLATNTVPGPAGRIAIAPALADAIRRHGLLADLPASNFP